MDPIWKELPLNLSERVCNTLTKVRRIDENLANDIKNQWYMYDRWYYNYVSLFGTETAHCAMYDDMKNVCGVIDDFPEEMGFEQVIQNMWMRLSHDDRKYLISV